MIVAEHRRWLFSEQADVRSFMPDATLAEIVASFDKPQDFERFGAVMIYHPQSDRGVFGQPVGEFIERERWHRVKPKDGTGVFVSCMPQAGGAQGQDGDKQVFQLVGMIALLALSAVVSGGLSSLFAAGSLIGKVAGAVGAATVLVGGSYGLSMLTKPPAGQPAAVPGGNNAPTLGAAGIAPNQIGAYQPVPTTRGKFRHSPPHLSRPFTLTFDNDQWVYVICGQCGPAKIENIKVNKQAITDLPAGTYEYETREGWDDDLPLTIVTKCVYQETINRTMPTHRLEADQSTLVNPYEDSYPPPEVLRTERDCDDFRLSIEFPAGIYHHTVSGGALVPFRLRVRRVGESTWINLPEVQLALAVRGPARQEIWLRFGPDSLGTQIQNELANQKTAWLRAYLKNPAWTADSYFGTPASGAVDIAPKHVYRGKDKLVLHLNTDTFPIGQYDVEIKRGAAVARTTAQLQPPKYLDLFSFTVSKSATVKSIPNQDGVQAIALIGNYATFRNQYPILDTNLALICARFKNIQVDSLSAEFTPYIDGVATSDPGANARDILVGDLNSRPFPAALVDSFSNLTAHASAKGLTVNALVAGGSVEKAFAMVLQAADAVPKRSDTWGCVIDNDRTAEGMSFLFTPHQMTQRLVVHKNFMDNTRAVLARFNDQDRDYAVNEAPAAILDDGVTAADDVLAIARSYEGIVSLSNVQRRALRDLRVVRLRSLRYAFGVNLEHLNCRKGDLGGIAHDILIDTYASGRIKSITHDGASPASLQSITLNTDIEDVTIVDTNNIFEVEDILTLGDVFTLEGVNIGVQVRLKSGGITTIPASGVSGPTLTVDGSFPLPDGWGSPLFQEKGCIVGIGPRDREVRRVILSSIMPRGNFEAALEAYDEAPDIHAGT